MKITTAQSGELLQHILEAAPNIAKLVETALRANADHARPANVNLIIKVSRNADDPLLIDVNCQEKVKAPKSRTSDITSWSEPVLLMGFRIKEEPGQTRLDE